MEAFTMVGLFPSPAEVSRTMSYATTIEAIPSFLPTSLVLTKGDQLGDGGALFYVLPTVLCSALGHQHQKDMEILEKVQRVQNGFKLKDG